jgi:uncharacterized protein (UPF0147 family)
MSYVEKIQKYLENLEKYLPGASKDDGLSIPIMMRKAAEEIVALQIERDQLKSRLRTAIGALDRIREDENLSSEIADEALRRIE